MSNKSFALLCIRQDVARHGHLTPEGMKIYRDCKLTARELSQATSQGLELYQQWRRK
ncbi:hypothetical protein [Siphonobacter curvatus]|uniref:hypothetical protein n=1 Tax=Siphonobacter curvatus TaxID=2094562 RepID=UPI0013FD22FE|nr:hypothetical protein [Siphonobacter curvatus]